VNAVFIDIETDIINGPYPRELFGQVIYFQQSSAHVFALPCSFVSGGGSLEAPPPA
jgi:hypothetical protein